MTVQEAQLTTAFTPSQRKTFDSLLEIGGDRPVAPEGLVGELERMLVEGTADALSRWTEKTLWMGKSHISTVRNCEGLTLAEASQVRTRGLHSATAIGIVAHRAIQIAHTHPNLPVGSYVDSAIAGSMSEGDFTTFWETSDVSAQSDLITAAVSKVASFLDSWPPLAPAWTPRFEESVQARLGKLVLSARVDLTVGRPRTGGRQTMMLVDLKSSGISDHHEDEASFYALVSALRHGVPPWRSFVYSLASGDYTDPDVTPSRLLATADMVIDAANRYVAVLTDERPPVLTGGTFCRWCPVSGECPSSEAGMARATPVAITAAPTTETVDPFAA
jgi:hypothetical protein